MGMREVKRGKKYSDDKHGSTIWLALTYQGNLNVRRDT